MLGPKVKPQVSEIEKLLWTAKPEGEARWHKVTFTFDFWRFFLDV